MLMQTQFEDTVSRLGLENSSLECDLAEVIWHRCEAAFQQKSPQVASLLKVKKERMQNKLQLTQQELQLLTTLLGELLKTGNYNMMYLKNQIKDTWLTCDRDNPNTKENFERLNKLRDYKRKVDPHLRLLEKIQHKLKKLR